MDCSESKTGLSQESNPNTREFYNKLYNGILDILGLSKPWEYERESRKQFYKKLAKLPFFDCSGKVLDVGCGLGGILSLLPEERFEKFGVDFSEVAVAKCKERQRGHFTVGDIHHLPYVDNFFDQLVCTHTLEHVDDVLQVIQEMHRVLRPNGKLLITVPEQSLGLSPNEWPGGISLQVNRFSVNSLKELVEQCGCVVESAQVVEKSICLVARKPRSSEVPDGISRTESQLLEEKGADTKPSPQTQLLEALLSRIRLLPEPRPTSNSDAEKAWIDYRLALRKSILEGDIRDFMNWDVIKSTIYQCPPREEFEFLKKLPTWCKFRDALYESFVGNPQRYPYYPLSTGNQIHQAYTLAQLTDIGGCAIEDLPQIVEFGGGFGTMCKLIHKLGFRGRYVIFDLPELSALQEYYLKAVGLNTEIKIDEATQADSCIVLLSEIEQFEEQLRIPADRCAFIAVWSLSETPIDFRNRIWDFVSKAGYFLIAYQNSFRGISNCDYFAKVPEKRQELSWYDYPIDHFPEHNYLIGAEKASKPKAPSEHRNSELIKSVIEEPVKKIKAVREVIKSEEKLTVENVRRERYGENRKKSYASSGSYPVPIKTMAGRPLQLPQLPSENSQPGEVPSGLGEIVQDVHKWSNPKLTYLASADQWLGFEAFFSKNHLMQCDTFYCVIGGLGGLNLLALLKPLKKLVFYDVNIYAARIFDLQLQLIRYSSSVDEYISLIYQRLFDSSKYTYTNQMDFLQLPIEQRYGRVLQEILTPQAYETYTYFYLPYVMRLPQPLYDGPTIHCTHLPPFFESQKLTDPVVSGPLSNTSVNVNTFYAGKGWLSSNEMFLAVRSHLLNSEIEVLIGDIAKIQPAGEFPGIYTTNIYSTHPDYSGYKQFIHLFRWMIGYDDGTDYEVRYYSNDITEGMVQYQARIGAGNGNPHATCCQALDGLLDLHANEFLEVIEPDPIEGMNYGFQSYKGQKKIAVEHYLRTDCYGEQIIAVHILLGGGVAQKAWQDVCRKAVRETKSFVFILEHRKECTNWPESYVHSDNLISHKEMDQFIYSLDYRWKKYGMPNIKGDINDIRNILYFLEKDGQDDVCERDSGVSYADVKENRVAALEFFRKGVRELRLGNSAKALNCFGQARSAYPKIPNLRFAMATAYAQLGDICLAEEACEVELALYPENDAAKSLLRRIRDAINQCAASHQSNICLAGSGSLPMKG